MLVLVRAPGGLWVGGRHGDTSGLLGDCSLILAIIGSCFLILWVLLPPPLVGLNLSWNALSTTPLVTNLFNYKSVETNGCFSAHWPNARISVW